jgi:hypothetical protein
MNLLKNNVKLAGLLIILGMISGILSIASPVDSPSYLTMAAANAIQVSMAAIFQFLLCLTYLGFAILLYPIVKEYNPSLALGFLSFRIISGVILISGTIALLSILELSQEFIKTTTENQWVFKAFGNVLKITRDYSNHVFMVFAMGIGNLMLYILLLIHGLIPKWLSVWGIVGVVSSITASVLLLFGIVDVITMGYLVLNAPTAAFELALALWLISKGFRINPNGL